MKLELPVDGGSPCSICLGRLGSKVPREGPSAGFHSLGIHLKVRLEPVANSKAAVLLNTPLNFEV